MEKRPRGVAIYPGTFDPLTFGHVSLVRRALTMFDQIIVSVAAETGKQALFDLDERVGMAREVFSNEAGVVVEPFEGLLVNYVASRGHAVILRGLRAVSDFEFELQMALMNRKLDRHVETIFLMTDFKWLYISSTVVKQAARLNGDISGLVPKCVAQRLKRRFGHET